MKSVTRITLVDDAGEKFFGEGPARLLHALEKNGSLRAAAASMDMAYTKALKILKNAENALGFPLTIRVTGGRDGGGSRLTPEGKEWLSRYESYRDACILANLKLYLEFFPEADPAAALGRLGCVIMASGLGRRFGGNKLMADFKGKPMIQWTLDATKGIFARRIVVTRHKAVEELCRRQGIEVIFHDLPYRSDTVRLGLAALARDVESCMFCAGDQPLLRPDTIISLALSAARQRDAIWRAAYKDTAGAPVLFPQWTFPELLTLPEGQGGSYVLKKYPGRIRTVSVRDQYELMDVDSPEDLRFLTER